MRNAMPKAVCLATAFVICFATGALAATTVQLTIKSASAPDLTSGAMGGVYTSPYTGQINGGALIPIICDDFYDDIYPPQTWTALATNLAQLGASTTNDVYFDQGGGGLRSDGSTTQQFDYMTAAVLAEEILNTTNETTRGVLSFALWGVFDPSLLVASNPKNLDLTAVTKALQDAQGTVATNLDPKNGGADGYPSTFSNVTIYSATLDGTTPMALGTKNRPQEFLVVSMAEPSAPVLLLVDLLAVLSLVCFFRKRQRGASLG